MLHDNKTHTVIDDYNNPAASGTEEFAKLVGWAFSLLRRQYLVILFVAGLGIGVGIVYLVLASPIYTAETTVYVDLHRNPADRQESVFGNDPIEIDSQIEIVKSKHVASSVIKKLQLTNDPELKPIVGDGLLARLFGHSTKRAHELDPVQLVIPAFEKNLTVDRAASRVISIKYDSKSPERAAEIANAIADAYIADQLEGKVEANRIASGWLLERQKQLHEQADTAQRAVEAFKKQHNIIATDGRSLDDKQVAELTSRLIAARAQAFDNKARLDRLEAIVRSGPSDPNVDGGISELSNPIITALRTQYLELSRRESEWSARYGPTHLAVVNLRNRMQEIRKSMFDELRRAADTAKNDYELAKQRQENIAKQLANEVAKSRIAGPVQVTLRGLENTAASYRALYDTFVQRYMGKTEQVPLPITEARVISPAFPPQKKSKPKTLLVIALSVLGGVGLGFGLAILRDVMDRVFRTSKQIETALQVPCIAMVPLMKGEEKKHSSDERISDLNKPIANPAQGKSITTRNGGVFCTVIDSPLSGFTEAIRSIKLAIDLHMATPACKIIGMTSAFPNEGKSTLAAALALLTAQVGRRVLLVDCDLRNPHLTRALAPGATIGIVDVISGKKPLAEAISNEPITNMKMLPTGKKIARYLTSEMLSGESMKNLFEKLRPDYDYIIVDLPPLTPIVDVRASTHLVDAFLLTVEWGRTNVDAVEHALQSAPNVYEGLIGTILNKTDMDFITRYDSSGRYGYNKHFARYGYVE